MSEGQREVARLLCLGLTKAEVGRRLGLSPGGVEGRLRRAYRVTGARCQIELGMWCVAHGVVTVPELQRKYCGRDEVGAGAERQSEGPAAARAVSR